MTCHLFPRLLVLMMAAGLSYPALSANQAIPAAAADDHDAQRKICKVEKRTNSRFTTKVCHTKAEWDAINEVSRKAWGETRDRPVINTGRGN